jgi:hypothetical protein
MTTRTGNFSNLLAPGLRKIWMDDFKGYPKEFDKIFNINSSTRNYEDDYEMTMLGGSFPAKPEGESIQYVDPKAGNTKRYTHSSFGMGFRVTEEMYEDDLYGKMKKMDKGLAKAQNNTVELQAIGVLDDAFGASAVYTGFDGYCLCYASHTILFTGGTYGNTPSTQADLSITTLQAAITNLEKTPDSDGVLMVLKPKWVIIAPDNKFIARELLRSEYKPYTSGNEINALMDEELKYFVTHYLSDTDAWFIQCKEHDLNFFWRRKPRFDNSDDFDTGDAKFKATHRSIQGFGSWRGIYGSSGG